MESPHRRGWRGWRRWPALAGVATTTVACHRRQMADLDIQNALVCGPAQHSAVRALRLGRGGRVEHRPVCSLCRLEEHTQRHPTLSSSSSSRWPRACSPPEEKKLCLTGAHHTAYLGFFEISPAASHNLDPAALLRVKPEGKYKGPTDSDGRRRRRQRRRAAVEIAADSSGWTNVVRSTVRWVGLASR